WSVGKLAPNRVPYVTGIRGADLDDLKSFCASVVTYGSKPLFYIQGMTPGSERHHAPKERVTIRQEDLEEAYKSINDDFSDVDFVCLGCPHCSIKEIGRIAALLKGKRTSSNTELWVACSRSVKLLADKRGYTDTIEEAGGKIACDTCMAVAPLKGRFRSLATTSAKGCYYSRHNNMMTKLGSLKECIEAAVKGKWS
ncbi:MAG: aconitase X catalytic domain-containing protein, partial [Candidatus Bathyarchaeota archaeon]|nr:aconitase X catalytic domain-containing protein [Candidatus Bathyarchaeota archaeon]